MIDTKQILTNHKVIVAIPTFNNGGTIRSVIEQTHNYTDDIIVVDDGSTDETLSILTEMGVCYISYPKNRGKGYAIKQSFKYAIEHQFDYVLTIDSDGQHFPSDILLFAQSLEDNPNSLIVGARNFDSENMPSRNTFANKFSNFWFFAETGKRLSDTQSGFRLYPIKRLEGIKFFTNRYEFEVETIVRGAWNGVEVLNIPISVYYPPDNQRVSHFKPFRDFVRISTLNSVLFIIALFVYFPWKFIKSLKKENIKRFIQENIINSKQSNNKVAASIGLGIFFGIFPIWGYQMIVAGVVSHFLKLNTILTVICSNISVPPMIPFILYGSYYTGGLLLSTDSNLSLSTISFENVYNNLFQYLYGAVVFGAVCGIAVYIVSFLVLLLFRGRRNG